MVLNGCFSSCFFSVLNVMEKAKMNILVANFNVCPPFLGNLAPANPLNSRSVGFYFPNIHHVLGFCCLPKVAKPIVGRVIVNVVNYFFRPFSSCYGPCNPMGLINLPMDANQNPSIRRPAPRNIAHMNSFAVSDFPKQQAILWVVFKHFAEFFRRHHCQYLPQIPSISIGGCHR